MKAARAILFAWAVLLALLALTIAASFALLGPALPFVSYGIAAAKTALIVWIFMEMRARDGLQRLALGREFGVPRVLGVAEAAGTTGAGLVVGPGTGDNAAAALGLGLRPGDVVVSLGTSGAVFADHTTSPHDPSGAVAGFASNAASNVMARPPDRTRAP